MTGTAWPEDEVSTLFKTGSRSSQLGETVSVDESTHTPGVVHLVGGPVLLLRALPVLRGRLQLPVVQTQQEHFGQLKHGLPLLGSQVAELVLDEIQNSLGGKRERRGFTSSHVVVVVVVVGCFCLVFRVTCSMLGFSKGGLPREPSTTGWLIWRILFLNSYLKQHEKKILAFVYLSGENGCTRAFAHLKQVKVNLFGVSVFLFVHRHEQILHIHHHP